MGRYFGTDGVRGKVGEAPMNSRFSTCVGTSGGARKRERA